MTPTKQDRLDACVAQHVAATMAEVSPNTWKLYESNPEAVSEKVRKRCELAAEKLRQLAAQKRAA